jgi:hypothetical protein
MIIYKYENVIVKPIILFKWYILNINSNFKKIPDKSFCLLRPIGEGNQELAKRLVQEELT